MSTADVYKFVGKRMQKRTDSIYDNVQEYIKYSK